MSTKTINYRYAAYPVEGDDLGATYRQLMLAHRYQNKLTEIEQRRRVAREQITSKGDLAKEQQRALLVAAYNEVKAARKDAGSGAPADCLYWGTYLTCERGADSQRSASGTPRFRRWDGCGTLSVQIQHGLSVSALTACTDTKAQLKMADGNPRWAVLRFRIGTENRAPVWARLRVLLHRPLPPAGRVKWIHADRRRVGTHYRWSVRFAVEGPEELPSSRPGVVAVDIGWRTFQDGSIRVGYAYGTGDVEDPQLYTEDFRLPPAYRERWTKVCDLHSIRDKLFNEVRATLCAMLPGLVPTRPAWLAAATATLASWKSQSRLAGLVLQWRDNRFARDEIAYTHLEAWRKRDKHLYEWESNGRENVLAYRREMFRLFAVGLTRKFGTLVIEDALDLRRFSTKREDDEPIDGNARAVRVKAAPGELRTTLLQAAEKRGLRIARAPMEHTTTTCWSCGHRAKTGANAEFDPRIEVVHRCSACLAKWDQDENAARNLHARWRNASGPEMDKMLGLLAAPRRRLGWRNKRGRARVDAVAGKAEPTLAGDSVE